MSSPCTPHETIIQAPCGDLELVVNCPTEQQNISTPWAVICHPNPAHGGAMTNKVVYMISRALNALGVATVRFNFRGVGKSAGEFDHGVGETEDLRAVVDWVKEIYQPDTFYLAGFSFGSHVALRGHAQMDVDRLLLVAPSVERFKADDIHLTAVPTLVIQGRKDDIVAPDAVAAWIAAETHQPQLVWQEDADHFFHGKLNQLREIITENWKV